MVGGPFARADGRRAPFRAWRAATYGVLAGLAALAWLVSDLRMAGMGGGPGAALGTLGFFVVTWVVMMVAMMFPSAAPMVATFVTIQRGRRVRALPVRAGASGCFVAGYLLVWAGSGLAAYAVVRLADAAGGLAWDRGGHWLAFAVLLAAAGYELTPWKRACLTRCRGPVAFLLGCWRDGRAGALWMGAVHGAWCLGCCWALMAALFALGVMNLAWMALVGVLIAVEKLSPWRRIGVAATVVVLGLLALGVAIAPDRVPGLQVSGSTMSMH